MTSVEKLVDQLIAYLEKCHITIYPSDYLRETFIQIIKADNERRGWGAGDWADPRELRRDGYRAGQIIKADKRRK